MESIFCEPHRKALAMIEFIDQRPSYQKSKELERQMQTWETQCKDGAKDRKTKKVIKCPACTKKQMAKGQLTVTMIVTAVGRAPTTKIKSVELLSCDQIKADDENNKHEDAKSDCSTNSMETLIDGSDDRPDEEDEEHGEEAEKIVNKIVKRMRLETEIEEADAKKR